MKKNRKGMEWMRKTFSLDPEDVKLIEELASFEDMSQSEFIGFIAKNWSTGINPEDKLEDLFKKRADIVNELGKIDDEIKDVSNQLSKFKEWEKNKNIKKKEALSILKRKILEQDFEEAERLSKVWQRITGINSLELLYEAKKEIEKSGV